MADPERVVDVLARLREVGAGTSLDDFGIVHSSVAHLKQPNVDELKIDRSFVLGMAEDERNAAIVHSTVDLARRLGLRVIAEGVETQAAWELLAESGCDQAHGYFLMRPMSPRRSRHGCKESANRPRSPRPPNRGSSTTSSLVRRPDKRPSTWRQSVREQTVRLPRCRTPEPDPNAGPDPPTAPGHHSQTAQSLTPKS